MNKLNGKVAIITGASKGIGAAIAIAIADAGAKVVVNYASSESDAARVVSTIEKAGGVAVACRGNVADPDDAARIFNCAIETFGQVDILVNNAGVFEFGPVETVTVENFRRQYDVNVLGPILMIQQAIIHFGSRGGSIVNISSLSSTMTSPNSVVYSGSKRAVDAITEVLSKELGPRNIRVNSINPGATQTEGAAALGIFETEYADILKAKTPLGRFGRPEDIAPLAVFLASEDSSWITGQIICASGGLA